MKLFGSPSGLQALCRMFKFQNGQMERLRELHFKSPLTGKIFKLYHDKDDFVIPHAIEGMRAWDFFSMARLYRLASKMTNSRVFVDVGANIGTSSLIASETLDEIYCVEADAENIQILRKNMISNNINAYIVHRAASNKSDRNIHLEGKANGNSGVARIAANSVGNSSESTIRSIRIDALLVGISPAFIHIDTEGHDLLCLEGSVGLISSDASSSSCRPFIQIEFCPQGFLRYSPKLDILWSFIQEYSYQSYIITNNHLAPIRKTALEMISDDWIHSGGNCWMDVLLIPSEVNPRLFYEI
jgi:FkbM family methyltransferase